MILRQVTKISFDSSRYQGVTHLMIMRRVRCSPSPSFDCKDDETHEEQTNHAHNDNTDDGR